VEDGAVVPQDDINNAISKFYGIDSQKRRCLSVKYKVRYPYYLQVHHYDGVPSIRGVNDGI
jgi:hypothetical protein